MFRKPTLQAVLRTSSLLLDLETQNDFGETALLKALDNAYYPPKRATTHWTEISFQQATMLIQHKANCNAQDYMGRNSLHYALKGGRSFNKDTNFPVYCPRRILKELLILLIRGGADIYAQNLDDRTPSHIARDGGHSYERSWREALITCEIRPQDVYEKSEVGWRELPDVTAEDELAQILRLRWPVDYSGMPRPYWSMETLEKFLIEGIKSGADVCKQFQQRKTLSYYARGHGRDRLWSLVLERCGHDPKEVYERSGLEWREPKISDEKYSEYDQDLVDNMDDEVYDVQEKWRQEESNEEESDEEGIDNISEEGEDDNQETGKEGISETEDCPAGDDNSGRDETIDFEVAGQVAYQTANFQLGTDMNPWASYATLQDLAVPTTNFRTSSRTINGGVLMEIEDGADVWNNVEDSGTELG